MTDGIPFSFLVGDLHHGASDRDAHWKKLQTHLHSFDHAQMFVLADFNSGSVPSGASAVPNDLQSKASVEAKKTEIHALSQLNVTDAHLLMNAHLISLRRNLAGPRAFPEQHSRPPSKSPKAHAHTHTHRWHVFKW